jgi:hypothetical protein
VRHDAERAGRSFQAGPALRLPHGEADPNYMPSTLIYIIAASVFAVGIVAVALVLAWHCPKEKIPELAHALSRWFGHE